jgi:hypothetical protein
MFNCTQCQQPTNKMERVVMEIRPRTYYTTILMQQRTNKKIVVARILTQEEKESYKILRYKVIKAVTTQGSEIVKETQLCKKCVDGLNKEFKKSEN